MINNKSLSVSFDNSNDAIFPTTDSTLPRKYTNVYLLCKTSTYTPKVEKILIAGKTADAYKTVWGSNYTSNSSVYLRTSASPMESSNSNRVLVTDKPVNGKTYYYYSEYSSS